MKNFLRFFVIIAGTALGPGLVVLVFSLIRALTGMDLTVELHAWAMMGIYLASGLIFGIIFIFISRRIVDGLTKFTNNVEEKVSSLPARGIAYGVSGLIIGLLIAFFLSWIIDRIPILWISLPVNIIVYIICAYLGVRISLRNSTRMDKFFTRDPSKKNKQEVPTSSAKVLDTSVIIDGRIFDICKTGIIEGTIVIPEFVLSELRHIADSADSLKRSKGRRGLDILNKIQRELPIPVEITSTDYDDVAEVDAKLLRLAKELGGKVVTNDFNLNKVAAVQGVSVLNVNELSNAVKPVLLPGEELSVSVIKEGKEQGQGVAYLDDGTMIVVENGRSKIGCTLDVTVTSALQTSAGRMIFARAKE